MHEFARENFDLKMLLGLLLSLLIINSLVVVWLLKRGPAVIALSPGGEIAQVESKITDSQIQSAVRQYLSYRYTWSDTTIGSQLKRAELFVSPSLVSAFEKSMIDVQKFVHEKKVNQRLYPKSLEVDLKEMTVTVLADRITEFDQLKAATEMKLTLQFSMSERTVVNPWGVYITKESEKAGE